MSRSNRNPGLDWLMMRTRPQQRQRHRQHVLDPARVVHRNPFHQFRCKVLLHILPILRRQAPQPKRFAVLPSRNKGDWNRNRIRACWSISTCHPVLTSSRHLNGLNGGR